MRLRQTTTAMALALIACGMPAFADMDAAKAFLDTEIGDLSTLSRADQEAEMQWFVDAAKPFAGMEIKVVSETIGTHEYESKVLAPAFTAITGIKITHIPYKGTGPGVIDTIAGNTQMMVAAVSAVIGHINNGHTRIFHI